MVTANFRHKTGIPLIEVVVCVCILLAIIIGVAVYIPRTVHQAHVAQVRDTGIGIYKSLYSCVIDDPA